MKITILTLFPEMVEPLLNSSILKRAQEKKLVKFEIVNFRDFSTNKHKTVDDTPYGGGSGMVLAVEPIFYALESLEKPNHKILLSPQGSTFTQNKAKELLKEEHLTFICGHYEGFDERVLEFVDEEISLGDFVMTGGEIASLAMIDAIVRLIPGVLGSQESFENDSFYDGLLDYPQYTKPREFKGLKVPDVLLSGDHAKIDKWREEMSKKKTLERRPDLFKTSK
ncbi:MAG: tRNA (guanosine(37)-N1)-methyltransferase TrmD [Tenericutes bacterium HGW-Tenericutes-5]|nr:MAG: tRNA (guanosine(37)-N1)-methyltransferase TrmD [Tenericutes bacterium HGW-Tenericutes-5]